MAKYTAVHSLQLGLPENQKSIDYMCVGYVNKHRKCMTCTNGNTNAGLVYQRRGEGWGGGIGRGGGAEDFWHFNTI